MKLYYTITPEPVQAQHQAFEARRPTEPGEILTFAGVDGRDVYNPSVPFELDGMTVLAGRVEAREGHHSEVVFLTPGEDGNWCRIPEAPTLQLEDPFVTFAGGELILGGVRVEWEDVPPGAPPVAHWCTDFYRGRSLRGLRRFASGPDQMKDVRLLQLREGRVAIFTRPQGAVMEPLGCIAKIGFTLVDSLDDVTAGAIENAQLLYNHFLPDEWGGCNQLFELSNGLVGAIGHKSWGEMIDGVHVLHYYAMAFALDPDTRRMTPTKVIADRACFPPGPAKEPRLADVIFTAGIVRCSGTGRHKDGTATLYSGLSDCQVGRLRIADPLLDYERLAL